MSVRDCVQRTGYDGTSWCWTHVQPYATCDGGDPVRAAARAFLAAVEGYIDDGTILGGAAEAERLRAALNNDS
jgi:hypothetical protein